MNEIINKKYTFTDLAMWTNAILVVITVPKCCISLFTVPFPRPYLWWSCALPVPSWLQTSNLLNSPPTVLCDSPQWWHIQASWEWRSREVLGGELLTYSFALGFYPWRSQESGIKRASQHLHLSCLPPNFPLKHEATDVLILLAKPDKYILSRSGI